jgi:hypothetical protein
MEHLGCFHKLAIVNKGEEFLKRNDVKLIEMLIGYP